MTIVYRMGIYCQYFINVDDEHHLEEYITKNSTHNAHNDHRWEC